MKAIAGLVPESTAARLCVCCGCAAATRSMPACWDHWILLPADLQSSIIKTAGRGRLADYGRYLSDAIAIWRRAGAWRSKSANTASSGDWTSATPILAARTIAEFLRLAEQRRKTTIRQGKAAKPRPDSAAGSDRADPMLGLVQGRNDPPKRPAYSVGYRPGDARLAFLELWSNDNASRSSPAANPQRTRRYARPPRPAVSKSQPQRVDQAALSRR